MVLWSKAFWRLGLTSVGASLVLTGCLKGSLASPDMVRTGFGSLTRMLMPVPVALPGGGTGVCAYVTRPSPDQKALDRLSPRDTQGSDVLTAQAIPHAEFLAQLRDPVRMKGLGGLGNDIIADLSSSAAVAAFAATAIPVGFQIGSLNSEAQKSWKIFKQGTELKLSGLFEMEGLIEAERAQGFKELQAGIEKAVSADPRRNVDKRALKAFMDLLQQGNLSDGNDFYQRLFRHIDGGDRQSAQQTAAWLKEVLQESRFGNFKINQVATVVDAIKVYNPRLVSQVGSPSQAQSLLTRLDALDKSRGSLVQAIDVVKDSLSGVDKEFRQGAPRFVAWLEEVKTSIDEVTLKASRDAAQDDVLRASLPQKVTYRIQALGELSDDAVKQLRKARGLASSMARQGPDGAARVVNKTIVRRFGTSLDDTAFLRALGASKGDDVLRSLSSSRNVLRKACFQGGARFAKLMGCGLVFGFATGFGLKKMVFEPASSPVKQDQIAQALAAAPELVTDVNEATFDALANAIRSFESSDGSTPCSQGQAGSLFAEDTPLFDPEPVVDEASPTMNPVPPLGGLGSVSLSGGGSAEFDTNPTGGSSF